MSPNCHRPNPFPSVNHRPDATSHSCDDLTRRWAAIRAPAPENRNAVTKIRRPGLCPRSCRTNSSTRWRLNCVKSSTATALPCCCHLATTTRCIGPRATSPPSNCDAARTSSSLAVLVPAPPASSLCRRVVHLASNQTWRPAPSVITKVPVQAVSSNSKKSLYDLMTQ
jgi:hypothetical protein